MMENKIIELKNNTNIVSLVEANVDTLKNICNCVNIPVAAIGGINSSNILELSKSGISGVAVVSGIFASSDIEAAARDLRNKIKYII